MSSWFHGLTDWLSANPAWLGVVILVVACIECLAIAGIVVPGTVLLFALGVLAGSGNLDLWQTLLLAYTGGLLGDLLSYGLGRRFHENIRRLPLLRRHPEWIGSAELYFHRYGAVSLLVGRFIGPLRPMLPAVAGMLDMPFGRFVVISLLAAAGWAVAYMLPGWAAGAALRLPLPEGFWSDAAYVAAGLVALIGLSAYASLHGKRQASTITAAIAALLLVSLFLGWPHLNRLDEGLMRLVQEQRSTELDAWVVLVTRMGDFATQFAAGLLLGGLLLIARQWRATGFAAFVLIGTACANGLLKMLFARARPEVLLEPLSTYSFPSGHSSAAFAFFLVLGALAGREQPPRWRLTWMLLACLPAGAVALSRVYLGVHWPTDILAGALLASCFCALGLMLMQRRSRLPALPGRAWWLILPSCLALLVIIAAWAASDAMALYRYAGPA